MSIGAARPARRLARSLARLVVVLAASASDAPPASLRPSEAGTVEVIAPFLDEHCIGCHDAATKSGGLDLSKVGQDLNEAATFATWVKVHDRVRDGEMPPKDEERPPKDATATLLRAPGCPAPRRRRGPTAAGGAGVGASAQSRRVSEHPGATCSASRPIIARWSPKTALRLGFDKLGSALSISPEHTEAYMAVAEAALDEVIVNGPAPVTKKRRIPQRFDQLRGGNTSFRDRFAHLFADAPDALVRYTAFVDGILGFRANDAGTYRFRVRALSWVVAEPIRRGFRAGYPGDNGGGAPLAGRILRLPAGRGRGRGSSPACSPEIPFASLPMPIRDARSCRATRRA